MKRLALCATLSAATLVASPASARDFVAYASTNPILYRYAACMFEGGAASAEAQIEQCAPLKEELDIEAEAVIKRFHVIERYDVNRSLRDGYREIRNDTKQTRRLGKAVPTEIVAYLKCMGEGVMATEDYKNGDAIDYIGIEQPCYDKTVGVVEDKRPSRQLYLRFQQLGRLTWPAARQALDNTRGGTRLRFVEVMERSFLNLGLVPEVKDVSEAKGG